MESIEVKKHRQVISQFTLYKITGTLVNLVVWAYYYILLYKESGSIIVILTDYLVFLLSLFFGFISLTFYIDRLGYLTSFRISSIAQAATLIIIFL